MCLELASLVDQHRREANDGETSKQPGSWQEIFWRLLRAMMTRRCLAIGKRDLEIEEAIDSR